MEEGRKQGYPEKTPDNELQKMPHAKVWKIKTPVETRTHTLALVAG